MQEEDLGNVISLEENGHKNELSKEIQFENYIFRRRMIRKDDIFWGDEST